MVHRSGNCSSCHCSTGSTHSTWARYGFILHIYIDSTDLHPVLAIYSQSKIVNPLLWLIFVVEHCVMFTALVNSVKKLKFTPHCIINSTPTGVVAFGCVDCSHHWRPNITTNSSYRAAPIVFEAILLFLTLSRALSPDLRRTPVLSVLARDGLWAFIAIFRLYSHLHILDLC
jgi:hypothetical protein